MSGEMPPLSPEGAAWLNSVDLIHVHCGRRESEHPHGRFFGPGPCGFPERPEVEFRHAAPADLPHATTVGEVLSFTAKLAVARAKRGLLTEKEILDALDEAYRAGERAAQTPGTVA